MKRNQALAAAIGGAFVLCGLVACAQFPSAVAPGTTTCQQHQNRYCSANHCDLDITVSACSASGIKLPDDLDSLHLCKSDGAKTINWKLPPGGAYRFRDDGIDFVGLPNHDDFDPATKQKGPFKYSWDDKLKNGGGASFKYAIRIQDASGNRCDKDPRITND
ncbi:MAG TPA: hypothetical protein VLD35_19065 [Caldimonas sp.]|nr:hypothetical protein [Caldimonas sp.]